jgi:beta-N-acetylhexosaminidase
VIRDSARHLPLPRDLGAGLVVFSPLGSKRTKMEEWTSGRSVLGQEIQQRAPGAVEIPIAYPPDEATRRAADAALAAARVVVIGTLNAMLDPDQTSFIQHVRETAHNAALMVVGLRTPYDIVAMPWLQTYVCAYTSVDCSMAALAEVLFGELPARGRLPVTLPA